MKNSFVLFYDNKEIFDALSNEQAGILVRAIFEYEITGTVPELDAVLRIAFIPIKQSLDRNTEKYENTVERNKENARKRWDKQDTKNATGTTGIPSDAKDADNGNDSVPDNGPDNDIESGDAGASAPADGEKTKPAKKHKRGEYGWVMLTDDEYERLTTEYGENAVGYYIAYVDESAQSTKNKNKWRDWNLVVRKAIRDKWGNYASENSGPGNPFMDMYLEGEKRGES